jgi:hypothetical protein
MNFGVIIFVFVRLFVFQMKKDVRKRKKTKLNEKKRLKTLGDAFFFGKKRQLTSKDTKRRQLMLSDKLIARPICANTD